MAQAGRATFEGRSPAATTILNRDGYVACGEWSKLFRAQWNYLFGQSLAPAVHPLPPPLGHPEHPIRCSWTGPPVQQFLGHPSISKLAHLSLRHPGGYRSVLASHRDMLHRRCTNETVQSLRGKRPWTRLGRSADSRSPPAIATSGPCLLGRPGPQPWHLPRSTFPIPSAGLAASPRDPHTTNPGPTAGQPGPLP